MRKIMRKEVKTTIVQVAKVSMKDGVPSFGKIESVTLLGNLQDEKVLTEVTSKLGFGYTILTVTHETNLYKMAVEDFLKVAYIDNGETEDEEDIDEE